MQMRSSFRAALSLTLTAAFSSYMFAAPLGEPLVASATGATVNEATMFTGAALHSGDLVTTNAQGTAVLRLNQARVQFGHLTSANVAGATLRLNHGLVRVTGAVTVTQSGFAAVPAANTDFQVMTLPSGLTYVSVYKGSVSLTGFARPVTVPAGRSVSYDSAAAAAQGGSGGSFLIPGIVLGGVATAIAIVVGYDLSHNPAASIPQISTSPSQ